MELEEEYSRNRVEMKKIKQQATIMTVFYALYLAFILFEAFYSIFISKIFLIGILLVIASVATGFLGVYRKDNRFTIASLVLTTLHIMLLLFWDGFDLLGTIIYTAANTPYIYYIVLTIKNNNRYHWLEQQPGFPNFEVQQTMAEMDRRQREIKDPYAVKKEEIEKRTGATGQMEDL